MERILNYGEYEVFSEAAASCTASVMEKGEGRAVTEFCFVSGRIVFRKRGVPWKSVIPFQFSISADGGIPTAAPTGR